jgi:NAD-dependent SIR2 family protein deacetylase
LKKWCSLKSNPSFVFTSNVDGHFQKAGFEDTQVFECHGSINHLQCSGADDRPCSGIWAANKDSNLQSLKIDTTDLSAQSSLPKCPHCLNLARPNILMFDDYNWQPERSEIQEDRFQDWKDNLLDTGQKLVVIEIGAGTAIPSVRYASESMNTDIIRINPRESQGSGNVVSIASGALESLQEINILMNT